MSTTAVKTREDCTMSTATRHPLVDAAAAIRESREAANAFWEARDNLEGCFIGIADAIARQVDASLSWDELQQKPLGDVGPYVHWLGFGAEATGLAEDAQNFCSLEGLHKAISELEAKFVKEFEDAGSTDEFRTSMEAALRGETEGENDA